METTGKRILLVEDDRFLRRACEASLRQRGLAVTTAADGEEGLRLARGELPDLISAGHADAEAVGPGGLAGAARRRGDAPRAGAHSLQLLREQDIAEVNSLEVAGYFVKSNLSLQELGDLVQRVLEGRNA